MPQKILIIGASGLIGGAVADALGERGHDIIRASRRSAEHVDVGNAASVDALFDRHPDLDAVVTTLGSVPFRPLDDLTLDDFRAGFEDKVLGQLRVADAARNRLRNGGSITLTAGILADRPVPTGAAASVANGAINAYVLAAAPYLGRGLRINALSPNVLAEATGYHASFPGFTPVAASDVARAYVETIEGDRTGQVVSV